MSTQVELSKHEVERRLVKSQQRRVLEKVYPDYDPRRHDVFLSLYRRETDVQALREWMEARGI